MKFLFCNIGWMEHYEGLKKKDRIVGGGAYVTEHGIGHEVCNFSPIGRNCYGYVQFFGDRISLKRIGAKPSEDRVHGITVVWTAKRPSGGRVIVGWYKNATVFREFQEIPKPSTVHKRNKIQYFLVKAPADQIELLPIDQRTFEIPRGPGYPGRQNIWYADNPKSEELKKRVESLISGKLVISPVKIAGKQKQDQERKAKIEKAAIRAVCDHFEAIGYNIDSVEKDNLGWDLEAISGKIKLRIEVKGLSGSIFSVELTPNEFNAFNQKSSNYRLAVVLNALESPKVIICRHSPEKNNWVVEGENTKVLNIEIRQSATIKIGNG